MTFMGMRDDLIAADYAKIIFEKWKHQNFHYYWPSNEAQHPKFFHWNRDLAGGGLGNRTDKSLELQPYTEEFAVWEELQRTFLGDSHLLRCYLNAYTFGTEGAPHKDSNLTDEQTTILYLNEWKAVWGGETSVLNDERDTILVSVLPKQGRIFTFPSHFFHVARPISRFCPELRLVLVYKSKKT